MGIISATAYDNSDESMLHTDRLQIPRLSRRLPSSVVSQNCGIAIKPYTNWPKSGLAKVCFKPLQHLQRPLVEPAITNLSWIWHLCCFLHACGKQTPNWSGFMQHVTCGPHSAIAKVQMHPLIDLNPSNESCVYSTLIFVLSQARQLGLPVTCIMFDQPLWLKAVDICMSCGLDIVCRLGGFHLLMSFIGCIGHIMSGSGLQDIFLLNYGPNTVQNMLSGKTYDRAVRGHLLLERALMHLLLEMLLPEDADTVTSETDQFSSSDVEHLLKVCEAISQSTVDPSCSDVLNDDMLCKVVNIQEELKRQLSAKSRTAALWIQYLSFIQLLKNFIIAERTGNWHLHLSTTTSMLPLLLQQDIRIMLSQHDFMCS